MSKQVKRGEGFIPPKFAPRRKATIKNRPSLHGAARDRRNGAR
jgi:hypothetical protein